MELTPMTITKYKQQESDEKIISDTHFKNTQIFKEQIKKFDPNQNYENKSNTLDNVHFLKNKQKEIRIYY